MSERDVSERVIYDYTAPDGSGFQIIGKGPMDDHGLKVLKAYVRLLSKLMQWNTRSPTGAQRTDDA